MVRFCPTALMAHTSVTTLLGVCLPVLILTGSSFHTYSWCSSTCRTEFVVEGTHGDNFSHQNCMKHVYCRMLLDVGGTYGWGMCPSPALFSGSLQLSGENTVTYVIGKVQGALLVLNLNPKGRVDVSKRRYGFVRCMGLCILQYTSAWIVLWLASCHHILINCFLARACMLLVYYFSRALLSISITPS